MNRAADSLQSESCIIRAVWSPSCYQTREAEARVELATCFSKLRDLTCQQSKSNCAVPLRQAAALRMGKSTWPVQLFSTLRLNVGSSHLLQISVHCLSWQLPSARFPPATNERSARAFRYPSARGERKPPSWRLAWRPREYFASTASGRLGIFSGRQSVLFPSIPMSRMAFNSSRTPSNLICPDCVA
jgi:hypothetical protein